MKRSPTCMGEHNPPQLLDHVTVDLPAGASEDDWSRALTGYLCTDCGLAYPAAVANGHPAGHPPTRQHVDAYLEAAGRRRGQPPPPAPAATRRAQPTAP